MTNHETRLKTLTMKFGGTSLGTADAIRQSAEITKAARQNTADKIAVVASALYGVTDGLHEATTAAAGGDERYLDVIAVLSLAIYKSQVISVDLRYEQRDVTPHSMGGGV